MIVEDNGWSTMTCIDKGLHHDLRRTFRSGLGADWLSRFEPAVPRNLDVLFGQLTAPGELDAEGWSRTADMRKWGELEVSCPRVYQPSKSGPSRS